MSFWKGFSFGPRPQVARKTREERRDSSVCSELVPKHDQLQQSLGYRWSFGEYGKTSFLDHPECITDTHGRSEDTSRYLSLTTVSLMRLVSEEDAVHGNIITPKTLAPARTSTTRVLALNNCTSFSSLAAISSPCKSCFPLSQWSIYCTTTTFCILMATSSQASSFGS